MRMLLGTVLGFDALTFNFVLLRAQCLRAMGRIKRGAVGMPKRNKIKREPVEAVETVPSPPQEAVEEAAAERSLRSRCSSSVDERCHGHWQSA